MDRIFDAFSVVGEYLDAAAWKALRAAGPYGCELFEAFCTNNEMKLLTGKPLRPGTTPLSAEVTRFPCTRKNRKLYLEAFREFALSRTPEQVFTALAEGLGGRTLSLDDLTATLGDLAPHIPLLKTLNARVGLFANLRDDVLQYLGERGVTKAVEALYRRGARTWDLYLKQGYSACNRYVSRAHAEFAAAAFEHMPVDLVLDIDHMCKDCRRLALSRTTWATRYNLHVFLHMCLGDEWFGEQDIQLWISIAKRFYGGKNPLYIPNPDPRARPYLQYINEQCPGLIAFFSAGELNARVCGNLNFRRGIDGDYKPIVCS